MIIRISWVYIMLAVTAFADGSGKADRYSFSAGDLSRNQSIDENVVDHVNNFSTSSEQIDYLNQLVQNAPYNRQKSTALLLMGETHSTNVITVLLKNLTFRDEDSKIFPAVRALSFIGEDAVEPTFVYIKTTTNHVAAVRGAEAIQMIKCKGPDCSAYIEWLKPRFDALPKHLQIDLGVIER